MCDLCAAVAAAATDEQSVAASAAARRARMDDEAAWAAAHPRMAPGWMLDSPADAGRCGTCNVQGGHAPWCHRDRSH